MTCLPTLLPLHHLELLARGKEGGREKEKCGRSKSEGDREMKRRKGGLEV